MASTPGGHSRRVAREPVTIKDPAELEDLTGRKLFREITEDSLRKILVKTRICKLDAQQRLSTTVDGFAQVYIILEGYVSISIASRFDKNEKAFLAWRGPEQIIGEMKPTDGEPSTAIIETCDDCKFIEIRNDALMDWLAPKEPLVYRNIASLLMEKMITERHRSEIIHAHAALIEMRIAQSLIYLAEERCSEDDLRVKDWLEIPGSIRQTDFGDYIGADRGTINHALKGLDGVVSHTRRGKITILDRDALKKIATDLDVARRYHSENNNS